MEGIFGIIDYQRAIEDPQGLALKMSAFLRTGEVSQGAVSLRFSETFVLGLKRTPMVDYQQREIQETGPEGKLALIHGEYHNYKDLVRAHSRSSDHPFEGDLDLALALYDRHGPEFGKKLNGLFSIGIADQPRRAFYVMNDRFGLARQIYWTVLDGRLLFATHLKTLLRYPRFDPQLDHEGLNLFLKYAYVPSPRTIYQDIHKLPPGSLLIFKGGRASVSRYWDFPRSGNPVTDLDEAVFEYGRLLKESISRRLEAKGEIGILLSGGLDSSANVALAAGCTEKRLKTFAIGFENPAFDERPFGRIVAQRFGTEHHEYTITGDEIEDLPSLIWHLEEPYFEFGLFLTYLGLASAKKEVDLVIGGEGADQLFGTGGFVKGLPVTLRYLFSKYHLLAPLSLLTRAMRGGYFYDNDNLAFKLRLLLNRVVDFNHWYFYGYDQNELKRLHKDPARAFLPSIFENVIKEKPFSFEAVYLQTQIDQDVLHYANENVMVKSGRMADMLGLTLRESYLDTEVANFLISMGYPFKRSGNVMDHLKGNIKTKFLHRKAMENLLPAEILTKPKQGGFVPVMLFLKDPGMRKRIYGHLLRSEPIMEHFNLDYIKGIFSNYESVQDQEIYWPNFYNSKANRILFLLTFDIWHRFYMANNPLDVAPPSLSDYLA
jgi:asparagine synthase (glutamine-hydrolysing)